MLGSLALCFLWALKSRLKGSKFLLLLGNYIPDDNWLLLLLESGIIVAIKILSRPWA
jgi:hypothetical protein